MVGCRLRLRWMEPAVWTGSSQSAVSTLDFEPCTVRKFQNTSCAVRPENRRPNTTFTAGSIHLNRRLMYLSGRCINFILGFEGLEIRQYVKVCGGCYYDLFNVIS